MKTIEEKAKRYDEAYKVAESIHRFSSNPAEIKRMEEIFPSLKEYEGERIRNVLIGWINLESSISFGDTFDGFSKEQILAWLEKQGKPVEINPTEFDLQLNKLLKQFETLPKEELINSLNFYLNVVQNNGTYKEKKQCEKPQGKSAVDAINEEKVDNQNCVKPSIKDEPKFRVGDWCIDNEDGTIFQIVKVLDNSYKYRTNEGKEYSCTHYSLELDARYWNISDAKDGDVLVDSLGNVCIYQEPSTKLMYHSHCYVNHKDFLYMGGSHEIVGSYPATKEQCDQLGKVMADAGYEFDFEKKELNEFGEYDGDDYGIDSLWHARRILKKTLGKVDGYQSDDGILEHKCAISAVDKLYKQKPSWSAEETFMVQRICKYLDAAKKYYVDSSEVRECIDWLKSLEERVLPRQKQ